MDSFHSRKLRTMQALASQLPDKSRKGGVDAPISHLISRINSHPSFFTTSSCSGRISILKEHGFVPDSHLQPQNRGTDSCGSRRKKKGGEWLYVSHDFVEAEEVVRVVVEEFPCKEGEEEREEGVAVLRYEPFILALECENLSAAQALVSCAISSGFRESGVTTMGKRIVIAIRCSIRMEVPIAEMGTLLVSLDYIRFLIRIANFKMTANQQRTERFFSAFMDQLEGHDWQSVAPTNEALSVSLGINRPGCYEERALSTQLSTKLAPENGEGGQRKWSKQKVLSELKKRQTNILSRITAVEASLQKSMSLSSESRQNFDSTLSSGRSILDTEKGEYARMSEVNIILEKKETFSEECHADGDAGSHIFQQKGFHCRETEIQQNVYGEGRLNLSIVKLGVSVDRDERLCRWGHSTCVLPSKNDCDSSRLLIFGGYGGPGRHCRQNDLLLFDCKSHTLSTLNVENPPTPRMGHTASIVGMKMVVIGGREDPSKPLGDVCVLDLETMRWSFPKVTGARFPPRHRHAAVAVGGNIYIFGGLNNMNALGDLFVLDTDIMHWSRFQCTGEMPSRYSHALAVVDQKIYIFGGRDGERVFGDVHVLDLEKGTYKAVETAGEIPLAKFSHSMTYFNGFLLLLGGCPVTKQRNGLFLLDVNSLIWRQIPLAFSDDFLFVRHTSNLLDSQLVIVGGGTSCYAFGTRFSPPCLIYLAGLLYQEAIDSKYITRHQCDRKIVHGAGKWALKLKKVHAKRGKDALKLLNWLDLTRKAEITEEGLHVIFPITKDAFRHLETLVEERERNFAGVDDMGVPSVEANRSYIHHDLVNVIGSEALLMVESLRTAKMKRTPQAALQGVISLLLNRNGLPPVLLNELPKRWERLGDMAILPATAFTSSSWDLLGHELWVLVAKALCVHRIARQAPIAATDTRDSNLELLLGDNGWVQHRENGILYCFDATKCMYSSGNISEKLRVANMNCNNEVVLDLFAGIGYFTLPFLVKAGAIKVYACEMNPHALAALRYNLHANMVADSCIVLEGDNRIIAPQGVADRVCLGLLPTSESSWAVAVKALRPEGGVLHVHSNVKDIEECQWLSHVQTSIKRLSNDLGRRWDITIDHVEHVKWYAPHIRHIVADVKCKMLPDSDTKS